MRDATVSTSASAKRSSYSTRSTERPRSATWSYATRTTKNAIATYWQASATIVNAWNSSW
jgi:hypothetical protein